MTATNKTSKKHIAGKMFFLSPEINCFFLSPEIKCIGNRQQSNARAGQKKNKCFLLVTRCLNLMSALIWSREKNIVAQKNDSTSHSFDQCWYGCVRLARFQVTSTWVLMYSMHVCLQHIIILNTAHYCVGRILCMLIQTYRQTYILLSLLKVITDLVHFVIEIMYMYIQNG